MSGSEGPGLGPRVWVRGSGSEGLCLGQRVWVVRGSQGLNVSVVESLGSGVLVSGGVTTHRGCMRVPKVVTGAV